MSELDDMLSMGRRKRFIAAFGYLDAGQPTDYSENTVWHTLWNQDLGDRSTATMGARPSIRGAR